MQNDEQIYKELKEIIDEFTNSANKARTQIHDFCERIKNHRDEKIAEFVEDIRTRYTMYFFVSNLEVNTARELEDILHRLKTLSQGSLESETAVKELVQNLSQVIKTSPLCSDAPDKILDIFRKLDKEAKGTFFNRPVTAFYLKMEDALNDLDGAKILLQTAIEELESEVLNDKEKN